MSFFEKKYLLPSFITIILIIGIEENFGVNATDNTNTTGKIPTFLTSFEAGLLGISDRIKNNGKDEGPTTLGKFLNSVSSKFKAVYPGTKWCGGGDAAADENDLGRFNNTDSCCRSHDNCFSDIEAGKSLGPLLNNGAFTRSHCKCDHAFYKCLKKVDSLTSYNIGLTYFNVLRPQCFALEYPIVSCEQQGSARLFNQKCRVYKLDTYGNKTLQWFDNPDF